MMASSKVVVFDKIYKYLELKVETKTHLVTITETLRNKIFRIETLREFVKCNKG